jgi:hypothetical protein
MTTTSRHIAKLLCVPCAIALVALPHAALAQSPAPPGGGALAGDPSAPVLTAAPGALLGHTLHVRGTVAGAGGRLVRVERFDSVAGAWSAVTRVRAAADGSFVAAWKTDTLGAATLRAVPDDSAQVQASSAAPVARVTVYRPVVATWYGGPTMLGNGVACGGHLTRATLGVANRTLPCGTKVQLLYHGRTITVPVIDRGPYGSNASYDLTQATSDQLGMTSAGRATIGVLPQR